MKILHVSDYLTGYHKMWSGAEQACVRLLYLLDKNGYNINVISTKPLKEPKESYNFFFVNTLEDVLPHKLRHTYRRIIAIISLDLLVFIQFYYLMLRIKPDIIHIHNFKHLSFSVVYVAKIFKIPVVLSVYDYLYFCPRESLLDKEGRRCLKFHGYSCVGCFNMPIFFKHLLILRKRFIDYFLNKIDTFVVLSKSSFEILQQYGIDKKKIDIIYQPFPFRKMVPEQAVPGIKKPFLLFVGALSRNKGTHIAIESLVHIRKEIPNIRLYIVGAVKEGAVKEYVQMVNQILRHYELDKSVFFLEKLNPAKMYSIFKQSNVVIIPEQWPNMSPVVLTEAMILAKPIVASRIGGIPEFIRDGESGLLANPKDPHEFAEKIIWVLKHSEEANKLGKNATLDAHKIWNNDVNFKKIIKVYESLL